MYKESPFEYEDTYGQKAEIIDFGERDGLQKFASHNSFVPSDLQIVMRDIQQSPDPNLTYLYDRALGAGEIYGPNNNGDWFGKNEIKDRHGTFVSDAYLFRHHKNKDPNKKLGDIIASAYNHKLDTADLILAAPTKNIKDDLKKLERDHVLATSMGAKVKHDVCSICGNKAKKRIQYCKHLRSQMLKEYPDGRQVYAKNPRPKFVDLSIVTIPADPGSAVLKKIASLKNNNGGQHDRFFEKTGGFVDRGNIKEGEQRDVIRPEVIESTNNLSRGDAVCTLHESYGELRPDEFMAVMEKDASLLRPDKIPVVHRDVCNPRNIDGRVLHKLAFHLEKIDGLPLVKEASVSTSDDFMTKEAKHYYLQYRRSMPNDSGKFLR